MATTPQKPAASVSEVQVTKTTQVSIHGSPPKPDMAPPESTPDVKNLPDNTKAEMAAGKKALESYQDRLKDELAAGKKAASQHNSESNSENNKE